MILLAFVELLLLPVFFLLFHCPGSVFLTGDIFLRLTEITIIVDGFKVWFWLSLRLVLQPGFGIDAPAPISIIMSFFILLCIECF